VGDIHYLICTHFDQNHVGGHDAFPNAELIVQRQHYDVARAGTSPRFERVRTHWNHPDLRYRLIVAVSKLQLADAGFVSDVRSGAASERMAAVVRSHDDQSE
jgi:glyoxylase-like metal-dependent hydrolase (beta-lactamase superfamily II)